ncbi:hypothetical protein K501DRAFT_329497 [Backusella circina FSU 941]|nr:hypothetical protein K501DRAFT_329497 [Backusella circina FSU 941]
MEAFAPLPVDLFADNTLMDDDPYFSLSQFDLELQQQAQAALQQESWQDFDKYLPIDNQLFDSNIRNEQAQPIFMNGAIDYTDPSLLYEPLVEITPPQQPQSQQHPLQKQYQQQQQLSSEPIVRKQSYPKEWAQQPNVIIKQEYASPESLPYSPPQPIANLSSPQTNSAQQSVQQDVPALQTPSPTLDFDQTISPKVVNATATPALDFTAMTSTSQSTWTSPTTPFESQGKVPIQRLKSNSIITNAVNAALNSSSSYSSTTNPGGGRQHKKTAHNAIERRYRNNINDRIAELKNAVPALLYAKVKDNNRAGPTGAKRGHRNQDDDDEDGEDGEEFLDGVAVATKLNKATILRKATEYINHLKKTGDDVKRENMALQNILIQLPGGQDVLNRYQMQKKQREKEIQQQQMAEREAQKHQEQQRKQANRKRARYNNNNTSHDQNHSDAYESSSSSPGGSVGPVTPPAMGSRVFMALFMCITFFSASPLTAGPNSSEQYVNHHHASRTTSGAENIVQSSTSTVQTAAAAAPASYLSYLFNTDSGWSSLRTLLFIVCIFQLFAPYLKTFFFGSSIKLKRVNTKAKRLNGRQMSSAAPGELKSREIYTILTQALIQDGDYLPSSTFSTMVALCKESMQLFSHHVLGYDILYSAQDGMSAQEEWGQVCKWIKLNEIKCLGGTSIHSRSSMIYSCFRMINLVDMLDEDKHVDVYASHARAYATAAMQMSLIIPSRFGSFAEKLSRFFWENAFIHQYQDQEDATWIQSLDLMEDSLEMIDQTRAWGEMMEILENSSHHNNNNKRLSLSYTAPVLVPVGILSTLYLLDNLYVQYDRLVTHMMLQDNVNDGESSFVEIMLLTEENSNDIDNQEDHQRLACWFATVGAVVDAIWRNNTEGCEKWLPKLIQRVPRAMTVRTSNPSQKANMNRIDELTKRAMIHFLMGALFIKQAESEEKQKQGLAELEHAHVLRASIRKLTAALPEEDGSRDSIESTVMTLADFVVSFIGLDAWIVAMKMKHDHLEKRVEMEDRVRELSLSLRRMIGHPSLESLSENQFIVDRLSRLCRYISHQDADSACDLSESDDDMVSLPSPENNEAMMIKKAERAHLILHGLA